MGTRTSGYPSRRSRVLGRRFKSDPSQMTRSWRPHIRVGVAARPTRRGPFFFGADTQQVKTSHVVQEVGRAVLSLGCLAAWAAIAFLIAGEG